MLKVSGKEERMTGKETGKERKEGGMERTEKSTEDTVGLSLIEGINLRVSVMNLGQWRWDMVSIKLPIQRYLC